VSERTTISELSMGWVEPRVGLGWVGSWKMDPWTTLNQPEHEWKIHW